MNKKKKFYITIDKKRVEASESQTVLEVAEKNRIEIPSLCAHSDLKIKASCRLCLVEIIGKKGLHTSCSTKVSPGMKIITNSPKIQRARKINLELLFAQHYEECDDCIWSFNCQLLKLAKKYKVDITRFQDRKTNFPVYQFGPSLIFDSSKCIDCRNCVDMCNQQGIGFLEIEEKNNFLQITPSKDKNKDCIYCGQCITHCPAGAFEAVGEFEDIEEPLKDKTKTIVFQFAPSIRTSIAEEFHLPPGLIVTEKLVAGIKKLGVDKVFDVSVGADFTTVEESKELIERLEKKKGLPMFTSCCPAWVKFVEFYSPKIIPNLTTVKSPHIILGGLIKTFWAKKEKIDPKNIVVVSIMPCVAKKYEAKRKELKINGLYPVDYVLTTRELAYLFTKHRINLQKIKPQKADNPLGNPTGAGVIYGSSGGVMESALRTTYNKLTGKRLGKIKYKKVVGEKGTREAMVEINKRRVRVAVVNGMGDAQKLLERLKKNPKLYDYVEVMACPGGCIGGGGQPVPTNAKIREKRAKSLQKIDTKKKVRLAHKNPIIKEVYKTFLNNKKINHSLCHTKFFVKKREVKL